MTTTQTNNAGTAPCLKRLPNGEFFKAVLKFDSRKDAVEAQKLIEVLERSQPVRFFARIGHGKKWVQFYCDGPETARGIRARFFRNTEIEWPTTPEEKAAHDVIEIPPATPITAEMRLQHALEKLERAARHADAGEAAVAFSWIHDGMNSVRAAMEAL